MNNLKKTMLALSLLIPVNSALALNWKGVGERASKVLNTASIWSSNAYYTTLNALMDGSIYIEKNPGQSTVLAVIATGLAATGIAYNKNTKFNRAVNDKLSPVKRFANNKLAAIQNKYADLKEKYNVTDAQEAKAKKIAKYTALAGASTAAVWGIANIYNKIKNK